MKKKPVSTRPSGRAAKPSPKASSTVSIDKLRERIDEIDTEMLRLLNTRASFAVEIGRAKAKEKKAVYVPEREQQVYKRLGEANTGPLADTAVKSVFREVMSACRSLERPLCVAFLGPTATFTHEASMQHFGSSAEFIPKKDISDVFEDVEKDRADFGVVPIENSSEGVVTHTLDMLITSHLRISAEVMIPVTMALLNKTGRLSDVRKVCSRPHAIAQCKYWLKDNLPNAVVVDLSSTALGAQMAAEDATVAAIASAAAASLYNLKVVENHIEDNANNFTRFLVIGKTQASASGNDKTSILFAIRDAPGALYQMLKPFARRHINLTKIESRPIKTKAWEYVFFVDLDGHINDKKLKDALAELEGACSFLKILGSYPKSC
ncbi:MAG: prephenate dehydratase [Deltaproteobacteria bacterium]|nr:prephenate dehydratase [Deltaproteobacteria bacterium]